MNAAPAQAESGLTDVTGAVDRGAVMHYPYGKAVAQPVRSGVTGRWPGFGPGIWMRIPTSTTEEDICWMFLMRTYHDAAYGDYIAQSYLLYAAYRLVEDLGGNGRVFRRRVQEAHACGWPKPRKGWPFPFEIEMH